MGTTVPEPSDGPAPRWLRTRRLMAVAVAGAATLAGGTLGGQDAMTPGSAAADGRNVALASYGAEVAVSGVEVTDGRWTAEKLIDGVVDPQSPKNSQSRWSSNPTDRAWATVRFDEPVALHHVSVVWEVGCAPTYEILGSTDGVTFTSLSGLLRQSCPTTGVSETVFTVPAGVAATELAAITVQAHSRRDFGDQVYGVSIFEVEAWTGAEPELAVKLLPQPAELDATAGEPFALGPDTAIVADGDARASADLLAGELRTATGYELPVVPAAPGRGNITITTGEELGQDGGEPEAYSLETNADGVTITAPTAHGAFNGVQTLRQLLPAFARSPHTVNLDWTVPAVRITDAPRFDYRGVMVDVARSFLTVEEVERLIDDLAAVKLNVLHLHLANDQGWRIEITNEGRAEGDDIDYTALTEVAGRTAMTVDYRRATDEVGRTGYYTQDEYRHLVRYAAERFVTVVPEIDVPGHTNAALHAIPQLNTAGSSHPGTPTEPTALHNGTDDVGYSYLDPDSEVTYAFMEHVFSQLAGMTPGELIHVGGDESDAMITRYGQARYDEMLTRIAGIVHASGKTAMGWNDLAAADLAPGDTIQFWHGDPAPTLRAAAEREAKIVLSPATTSYLDQKPDPRTPIGLDWACQGVCDFPQYYAWEPAEVLGVSTDEAIRGVEAPLWSETLRGGDQAELLAFMRALAHAEIGWTAAADRDAESFADRVAAVGTRFAVDGTNFYDGAAASWDVALAGTDAVAAPGATATINVGLLSAPGTKVVDGVLGPDVVDDADGVSRSDLRPGSAVTIDWGDGSEATAAVVGTARPRGALDAAGLYYLTGEHSYAAAGEYHGTITLEGRSAPFTVRVADGAGGPQRLQPVWDPTVTAQVALEHPAADVGDRVRLDVTGFEPGVLADVHVAGTYTGQLRPDEEGNRFLHVLVPAVPAGEHEVTVTQGERRATAKLAVRQGLDALQHRIHRSRLSVADVSSEEVVREHAPATAAIDGDPATFWHTQYVPSHSPYPHHVTIDVGGTCTLTGLEYTGRLTSVNTRIKDYEVYVSASAGERGTLAASGAFDNAMAPQQVDWSEPARGRYVTLVGLSSQSGKDFAGAAEVAVGGLC